MHREWWKVMLMIAGIVEAALLPAVASAALIVPDPFFNLNLIAGGSVLHVEAPGTYSFGGISTTATGLPVALLIGHAEGGEPLDGTGFTNILSYYFAVDGPENEVLIPMFVTFSIHASACCQTDPEVFGNAGTTFHVRTAIDDVIKAVAAYGDTDFAGTLPFTQLSGRVGSVTMDMQANTSGGVADASADPYIFIDPVFLASHPGYSVIVSPGIGNAAPAVAGVPEPATVLLLGTGLLGLLSYGWRRRRYGSAVPSTGSSS